jgi:hypothetical protein
LFRAATGTNWAGFVLVLLLVLVIEFMAVLVNAGGWPGPFAGDHFDPVAGKIGNALSVRRRAFPSLATIKNVNNPLKEPRAAPP